MEKDACIAAHVNHAKDLVSKKQKQEKKVQSMKDKKVEVVVYAKKYRQKLAKSCQKLARLIDARFGYRCIDCDRDFGAQADGGHFNSKGSNATLTYNLHNIHSQTSNCNRNGMGGGRRLEYYRGLVTRYGQDYADYVDTGLQKTYTRIGLTEMEVYEKMVIANKLIRDFDTFVFTDAIHARDQINTIIGIYKISVYSSCETIKTPIV